MEVNSFFSKTLKSNILLQSNEKSVFIVIWSNKKILDCIDGNYCAKVPN